MATRVSPPRAPYVVQPSAKHTATVLFSHGLGDTGMGWLSYVNAIKSELPHVKWVLPNAPLRPITINQGLLRPGWFDLPSTDLEDKNEDRQGLLESARVIDKYIQDEIDAGIPAERIVIGGFSQGGALSLLVGLTAREDRLFGGKDGWNLGGVAVLSGWLPLRDAFPKMASPHSKTIPILICHGIADILVPYSSAQKVRETLTGSMGVTELSFKSYEAVGHEVSQQTQEDLFQFLKGVLSRD